ncbi:rubredoxin [Siculibacillus lacustris]|uniref:Rubredoxin n=1 Tax=Siculibacillus lacustris TaxID=1549641 RepID=A0A4Q9VXH1_9HYPH|nr:rubredoxin [Siculibacillus lacustris]TBW40027.1 rubredoxin [Siculibacillus lacustris]
MTAFDGDETARQWPRDSRMECGICWTVYDPAVGDDVWQIPAGTAFADLPEDWRCPTCDAPRSKFMLLGTGDGGGRG